MRNLTGSVEASIAPSRCRPSFDLLILTLLFVFPPLSHYAASANKPTFLPAFLPSYYTVKSNLKITLLTNYLSKGHPRLRKSTHSPTTMPHQPADDVPTPFVLSLLSGSILYSLIGLKDSSFRSIKNLRKHPKEI